MSSPAIQILTILPIFDSQSDNARWQAVQTFIANMQSMSPSTLIAGFVNYPDGTSVYSQTLTANVTPSQETTVVGWLTTLNAAIGQTVICYSTNSQLIP